MAKTLVTDTDISLSSLHQQLLIKPAASNDSTTVVQIQNSAGTVVLNVDTTNGRVGIGTASPSKLLHVAGDALINNVTVGLGAGSIASNTAVGDTALASNSTGVSNSAFGHAALFSNSTGDYNSSFGYAALYNSTASGNSAFGYGALYNSTASGNSAFGYGALYNSTTSGNSAFGYSALSQSTTASGNSAFGYTALFSNITSDYNSSFGYAALYNSTGNSNSAFGYAALYSNISGVSNIGVGRAAGRYYNGGAGDNTTPSNSIYIGNSTSALANGQTNQIVIGDSAIGAGSNTVTLGHTTIVTTVLRGNVTATAGSLALKAPTTVNAATYSMTSTDSSLIITTTNCTITLLSAATYTGRILYIKNITATSLTSNASNVVPLGSATAGTAILAATAGKFTMLQSDGTSWITMMSN